MTQHLPPATTLSRRRLLALSAVTAVTGLELVSTAAPATASSRSALAARPLTGLPADSGRLTLPAPTGPERIGTVSLHLVDPARTDPWTPSHPTRELMVQIWYPAQSVRGYPAAPWLSTGAVPHFEQGWGMPAGLVRWPASHGHLGAPVEQGRPRPVVLYSPGYSMDRNSSTTLVEELASHGYIVVTIDHTHDSPEVEFPGGRIETGTVPEHPTEQVMAQETGVRAADARFVLDQLAALDAGRNPDAEQRPLPSGLRGAFDLARIGMFGHSLGGCTAAATMHDDPRVKAGLSLDGPFVGAAATAGSDLPFLLLTSDHDDAFAGWDVFWENQRGPKLQLRLTGSTHGSFTDGEVLYPQLAPVLELTAEQVVEQIGSGDPQRSVRVQRTYIRAFFDLHLRHHDSGLLHAPSPRYPEIRFVR
ncbi:alpha/beta hydrolase family protein [Kitasatospora sp. NPDC008050]|uniref:alpha/beta hydrolase family protein n=1 Tax=Kitasatospora sp. NPDC008050 TaxID=3364021 RepID=UPI0036EF9EF5